MPYIWTDPEPAAEWGNRKIYHTYKNNHLSSYWFTTDPAHDDLEGWSDFQFDIRDVELEEEIRQLPVKEQLEHIIVHRLVRWPEGE